ncbi:hypothetical protein Sipo7851_40560 [Streptomyces ipomoeae]|nr:hypothetical protein Sipo7851_40560 [Streptomyces ipomoeae]
MTASYSIAGRRRHVVAAPAESVPQGPAPQRPAPQGQAPHQDPPIYRALMQTWADRGRTLPGRHDPEWVRLATPPSGISQVGAAMEPFTANDRLGTGGPFTVKGSYGGPVHHPLSGPFRNSFSVTRAPRDDGR